MKHTYWAGLFHIAVFTLLAVLTPRSLSADPAGHAKTNAIRGEPYFNIATTQCIDYWAATSSTNVPEARGSHTAVWTGSEMIVWGGDGNADLNTGARYRSNHRQLDSHQHDQCALRPILSHGSVDRQ